VKRPDREPEGAKTASWLRRGLVFVGAASLGFAGIAYFRGLHHFHAPFLQAWLWQALAWLPWVAVFAGHRWTLDWCLREDDRVRLALRLALSSAAFAVLATVWMRLVSERVSPFLGAEETNMGVFRFFFIFWFLVQGLAYALVAAWAMLRAQPLPAAALRRDAEDGRAPAGEGRADSPAGWRDGKLVVGHGKAAELLDVSRIVWIESQDYYAVVHLDGGASRWLRRSLADLTAELTPSDFVRVHRSSLINLRFLEKVKRPGAVVLRDGTLRPVSRAGLKALDAALVAKPS
jgi:hypothetical protein